LKILICGKKHYILIINGLVNKKRSGKFTLKFTLGITKKIKFVFKY